jgi:hypothetical protein
MEVLSTEMCKKKVDGKKWHKKAMRQACRNKE